MAKEGNKAHKDKCKAYKAENRRAINKARKAKKLANHLAKCKAKYGPAREEKEALRKSLLPVKAVAASK